MSPDGTWSSHILSTSHMTSFHGEKKKRKRKSKSILCDPYIHLNMVKFLVVNTHPTKREWVFLGLHQKPSAAESHFGASEGLGQLPHQGWYQLSCTNGH